MRMSHITILICQTLLISEKSIETTAPVPPFGGTPWYLRTSMKISRIFFSRKLSKFCLVGILGLWTQLRVNGSELREIRRIWFWWFLDLLSKQNIEVKHFWNSMFSIVKNLFFEVGIRFYSFGPLGSFGQQPQATWADDDMFSHRLRTSIKLIDVSHTWCFMHCFNNFTRDWLFVVCLYVSTYI